MVSSLDSLPFSFFALKPQPITPEGSRRLVPLLMAVSPTLSPKHIPELLYLKERIRPINGFASRLNELLDTKIRELEQRKPKESSCDIVEQLCRLSLQEQHGEKETATVIREIEIIKMLQQFVSSQKNAPHEQALLWAIGTPLLTQLKGASSWLQFAKVMRVAELYFHSYINSIEEDEIALAKDLEDHQLDSKRIEAGAKIQDGVDHLLPIGPYLKIIAAFLQLPIPDDFKHFIMRLRALFWHNLLTAQNSSFAIEVRPPDSEQFSFQIVPLNMAVMTNDLFLVSSILANGVEINAKDDHGYTAAHMAAIFTNFKALCLLKRLGANFTLRSASGATVYDLLAARGFRKVALPYRSLYTQSSLFHLWLQKATLTDPSALLGYEKLLVKQFLSGSYQPMVAIVSEKPDFRSSALIATQDIPCGHLVMPMSGEVKSVEEVSTSPSDKTAFQLMNGLCIEFESHSSGGELIELGSPNCSFITVVIKGEVHVLIYAMRTIARGESLRMNFGRNAYDKWHQGPFVERHPEIVQSFIDQTSGLTYFEYKLESHDSNWSVEAADISSGTISHLSVDVEDPGDQEIMLLTHQTHYLRAMMEYLLNFPEYPLELIQKGKMAPSTFHNFLKVLSACRVPQAEDREYHRRIVQQMLKFSSKE